MNNCDKCNLKKDYYPDKGILYLLSPVEFVTLDLSNNLKKDKVQFTEIQTNLIEIHYKENDLERLCNETLVNLSDTIKKDINSIILKERLY